MSFHDDYCFPVDLFHSRYPHVGHTGPASTVRSTVPHRGHVQGRGDTQSHGVMTGPSTIPPPGWGSPEGGIEHR